MIDEIRAWLSNSVNKMEEEKRINKKTLIKTTKAAKERGIKLVLQISSLQETTAEDNKPKIKIGLRSLIRDSFISRDSFKIHHRNRIQLRSTYV